MPEENKIKKEDPKVDLDTSGPEVDVAVDEPKVEEIIETKEEPIITEVVKEETVKEIKKEQKADDSKLEDYSKGVQSRIEIDGGEVRLLNDDEILATVKNPEDILHKY